MMSLKVTSLTCHSRTYYDMTSDGDQGGVPGGHAWAQNDQLDELFILKPNMAFLDLSLASKVNVMS